MEDKKYQLEMRSICKQFNGVRVLNDVSLQVKKGEIHALVGENGAGKSTLIKILSGAYAKDSGEILIDGKKVNISSPLDAKRLGIAVIYQEFMLAPDLSVAENIFIDKLNGDKLFINWKSLRAEAKALLDDLGFKDISAKARVGDLSVAHQQVVEICKCLTRNARILVLDEPTAVLTATEISKFFGVIRALRDKGVSIIFISHHMEEIFEICDSVTVLKDGCFMGTQAVNAVSSKDLIRLMIGRELTQMFPTRNTNIGDVVLKVSHLNAGQQVQDINFEVRSGEILGFSGLVGSGRTEAMRAIFGADKMNSGEITMLGERVIFKTPRSAIKHGFGYLSENRKTMGLIVDQSIRINTTMASLKRVTRNGFLEKKKEKNYVVKLLSQLSTKYGSIENDAASLSGGNQQKIALAKWISAECKCMVFDEPTRGVDVGAKIEIYNILNKLAEQGVAIIMISSEMTEIIGMCDRAIVMRLGKIAGELSKENLSEENIIELAMKEVENNG
ncbi:MAG: sugar ABC transporter ATP-binding protein [Oscillospiraceae bacterium]